MRLNAFDKAAILFKDGSMKYCYIVAAYGHGNGMIKVAFKIPVSFKVLSYPNGAWEVVGQSRFQTFEDKRYTAKSRIEMGYSSKTTPSILFLQGEF